MCYISKYQGWQPQYKFYVAKYVQNFVIQKFFYVGLQINPYKRYGCHASVSKYEYFNFDKPPHVCQISLNLPLLIEK